MPADTRDEKTLERRILATLTPGGLGRTCPELAEQLSADKGAVSRVLWDLRIDGRIAMRNVQGKRLLAWYRPLSEAP